MTAGKKRKRSSRIPMPGPPRPAAADHGPGEPGADRLSGMIPQVARMLVAQIDGVHHALSGQGGGGGQEDKAGQEDGSDTKFDPDNLARVVARIGLDEGAYATLVRGQLAYACRQVDLVAAAGGDHDAVLAKIKECVLVLGLIVKLRDRELAAAGRPVEAVDQPLARYVRGGVGLADPPGETEDPQRWLDAQSTGFGQPPPAPLPPELTPDVQADEGALVVLLDQVLCRAIATYGLR